MSDQIDRDLTNDGIDRRGFLKCMAWVGTGVVWSLSSGGVLTGRAFGEAVPAAEVDAGFTFVQVSDSHIGFAKEPNKNVVATFQQAIDRINALPRRPELLIHTGDITHLAKPAEFDTVAQVLKGAKVGACRFVPGEHDVFTDDAKLYLERFGNTAGTRGLGWHSYDLRGVHFVGLVNVASLKPGGLGTLGREQLDWLKKDLESVADSTPVVVYAHVPLWAVYPKWGWGTEDSAEAMSMLRHFASVTVLNGHIHQVLHKTEGNITFHTACSTAFPQPEPGKAEAPGPIKNVAAEKLRSMLGLTRVDYAESRRMLAVVDATLE
jgi:3',5'-cyclic AMP phosphodiesterase CpdA